MQHGLHGLPSLLCLHLDLVLSIDIIPRAVRVTLLPAIRKANPSRDDDHSV
jgi:hypothetical protein